MGNRLPDTIANSIAIIQIRPQCIVEYYECLVRGRRWPHFDHIEEANEAKEELYGGQITSGSAKRLKKAVNLLIMSSVKEWIYNPCTQKHQPFQLGFLTLTISDKYCFLTAEECYDRLLKYFLQWLRRVKKCTSYIWKAELQQRGTIHYHLTVNKFIEHGDIRHKWNELQQREGLLTDYYQEHGHYQPNSIDIHSVLTVNNVAAYICKYVAKEQDADPIMKVESTNDSPLKEDERWGNILSCYPENHIHTVRTKGKIWDCSENLKKKKYWTTVMNSNHDKILAEAELQGLTKVIQGDNYKLHLMNESDPLEVLSEDEIKEFNQHMKEVREGVKEGLPLEV